MQLASADLSSTFVEASSEPQKSDGTRTGASRLSWPQHVNAPAQYWGTMRWYELKLGAARPQRPGRCSSTPATNERAVAESPSSAAGSWKTFRPSFQSEKWRWPPLPAFSGQGFGASEATRPSPDATPRIVSRTSTCSSAARRAGA